MCLHGIPLNARMCRLVSMKPRSFPAGMVTEAPSFSAVAEACVKINKHNSNMAEVPMGPTVDLDVTDAPQRIAHHASQHNHPPPGLSSAAAQPARSARTRIVTRETRDAARTVNCGSFEKSFGGCGGWGWGSINGAGGAASAGLQLCLCALANQKAGCSADPFFPQNGRASAKSQFQSTCRVVGKVKGDGTCCGGFDFYGIMPTE